MDVLLSHIEAGREDELINQLEENHAHLLRVAIQYQQVDIIKLLLRTGANPNLVDETGKSAITMAFSAGEEYVSLLDFNSIDDANGLLMSTIKYGYNRVASKLVEINRYSKIIDANSTELFGIAILRNKPNVVKIFQQVTKFPNEKIINLLSKGINYQDEEKNTPLILAIKHGYINLAIELINAGANVNSVNTDGYTSLILSSIRGNVLLVSALLKAGAEINVLAMNDNSALHWAAYNRHKEVSIILKESGSYLGVRNKDGKTPADLAMAVGARDIAEILE